MLNTETGWYEVAETQVVWTKGGLCAWVPLESPRALQLERARGVQIRLGGLRHRYTGFPKGIWGTYSPADEWGYFIPLHAFQTCPTMRDPVTYYLGPATTARVARIKALTFRPVVDLAAATNRAAARVAEVACVPGLEEQVNRDALALWVRDRWIRQPGNGWVVPPQVPEDVAQTVERLLDRGEAVRVYNPATRDLRPVARLEGDVAVPFASDGWSTASQPVHPSAPGPA